MAACIHKIFADIVMSIMAPTDLNLVSFHSISLIEEELLVYEERRREEALKRQQERKKRFDFWFEILPSFSRWEEEAERLLIGR